MDRRPPDDEETRRPRGVRIAFAVVVLLLLAWVTAVAVSGVQAALALQRVADAVPRLEADVRAERFDQAASSAVGLAEDAAAADRATSSWPYRLAGHVPWVGDQLRAVAGGSHAAAVLTQPLPDALSVARDVLGEGLVSPDQTVDVAGLARLAPIVTDYRTRVAVARASLSETDSSTVLSAIRDRLVPVSSQLADLSAPLDTAAEVLPQLPVMLGSRGPRTYLVAFTNPAEARPVQGILGAYAYLSLDQGRISLLSTGSDSDIPRGVRGDPGVNGDEYRVLYGEDPDAGNVQNVTVGGQADDAGRLTGSLFERAGLTRPDAVVFIDPVGLAELLGPEHAPLELGPYGAVASADLARTLMYDAYVDFDGDQEGRKAFLTLTSAAAFQAVLSGGLSTSVADGARRAFDSGHLSIWSADETQEAALQAVGAGGVLGNPRTEGTTAHLALTNSRPSKLEYWLQPVVSISRPCTPGANVTGIVELTLTNPVPARIPDYMRNLPGEDDLE
ncbi:MAG: DUF4012 domain-containing protein, partial [Janthinobacterium lividum]